MLNKQNNIKPIEVYLLEQEDLLKNIAFLLDAEFKALKQRDFMSLEAIANKKSELMLKLQSNDQRLKLHPNVALLKSQYQGRVQEIKDSLVSCKKKNDLNNRLANLCIAATNRLTSVLMNARDAMTKNLTYTQKGSTSARGPMRLSISA